MLVEGDIDQTMQRLRRAALGGDAAALHRLEAMIRRLPREKAQAEADATTIAEELVTLRREGQPAAAAEQRPWVLRLNGEFVEDFGARWGSGGQDPLPEAVEAREGIVRGLVKILERSSIELVPVPISADRA